ncbi:Lipocalin-like domain [Nesidiocoris tenuis]|uniref:Lipocalin-like domain n=1 Tax=Nesidiocoris tenuis TaxID=355587 RepID=A0ABN7B2H7_9HEMI|nr:Lipocalin-like domain [Nesidiocoris tenuis]
MTRRSILAFVLLSCTNMCIGQSYLPWKFGFCSVPPVQQNFNATEYFTGKWYQQSSFGTFLTQGAGICPTISNQVTPGGLIRQRYYQYEQLTMSWTTLDGTSYVSFVQNGQGYLPITYGLLNGLVPYEAPIYIVGTDYDNWAVIYSCRQQLFLKLEMSWTLTRTRNGTEQENILSSTVRNAGLDLSSYVKSTNIGCGPNEPSL